MPERCTEREPGASLPAAPEEVLRVEGLCVGFGGRRVLEDLNLQLHRGENLAILGKSGSGKSVFLRIITGLVKPDRGSVYLWGDCMDGANEIEWNRRRRRLGMVFQSGALFDSMTVGENVAFARDERAEWGDFESSAEAVETVVAERLEWVGLAGIESQHPSELSGGMRRRVALARTLAGDPEFVLYDEPTAGLDPVTSRKIARLMRNLDTKLESTSILVTHDIDCARTVSDTWAFLSQGRVLAKGPRAEVLASTEPEVQEFLSEPEQV